MPAITTPIIPPPGEPEQVQVGALHPRREFGVPIDTKVTVVKDHTLQRPVPKADGAKFGRYNNSSGLLFRDNNPSASPFTSDSSSESPTVFKTPNLVSNTTVSPSPLFGNINTPLTTHNTSPAMDSAFNDPTASLNFVSGIDFLPHHQLPPNLPDSDLAMKKLFDECMVTDFDEDPSFLFTPHTNETTFTHSSLTSGLDTPSIDLAQLDSYLNSTSSFSDQDFNLFGDTSTDDWNQNPLFTGSLAEDPIAPYAFFKNHNATVTTASPHQFSIPIGDVHSDATSTVSSSNPEPLPSPELSPPMTRKLKRQATTTKPVAPRRVSTTPFTPITPAPTTPSTPLPQVSRATKRRILVTGEDPAVVEKRRRNTIAAQRSRQRKAEEKAEDKVRIVQLEKEIETYRVLLSYWKDRACELGASPLEDGEN
jgi:hypothetical protein